jgi:hypothetical protein
MAKEILCTNPRDVADCWRQQFDWACREYDRAVFTVTIHPDVAASRTC